MLKSSCIDFLLREKLGIIIYNLQYTKALLTKQEGPNRLLECSKNKFVCFFKLTPSKLQYRRKEEEFSALASKNKVADKKAPS